MRPESGRHASNTLIWSPARVSSAASPSESWDNHVTGRTSGDLVWPVAIFVDLFLCFHSPVLWPVPYLGASAGWPKAPDRLAFQPPSPPPDRPRPGSATTDSFTLGGDVEAAAVASHHKLIRLLRGAASGPQSGRACRFVWVVGWCFLSLGLGDFVDIPVDTDLVIADEDGGGRVRLRHVHGGKAEKGHVVLRLERVEALELGWGGGAGRTGRAAGGADRDRVDWGGGGGGEAGGDGAAAGGVGGRVGGADPKGGLASTLEIAVGRALAADAVDIAAPPPVGRASVAVGAAAGAVGGPRGAFGLLVLLPDVAVAFLAIEQATVRRPRAALAGIAAAVAPSAGARAEAVVLAACAIGAVDEIAGADAFVARARSAVGF